AADIGDIATRLDFDRHVALDAIVHFAFPQAGWTVAFETAADAGRAVPTPDPGNLEGAVLGEQVAHVVPHLSVDIVAVDVLEIADFVLGVEHRDALGDG